MKTAEVLAAITDRGKFEVLVTSILRKDNKNYEAIIHTGVNAQDATIKSPLDGFCRVPNSQPPLFLIVHHTTTKRKNLGRKWLHERTTAKRPKSRDSDLEGDLVKAFHEAEILKMDFPNAKFVVILTTNQRPSKKLLTKVYRKADEYMLEVDIWEQSRITDFLDNKAEGQWLRKQYLGIEIELLSKHLLQDLCKKSMTSYNNEVSLTKNINWIPRVVDGLIQECVGINTYTICFLVGESGFGKSVAAYQILQKNLESNGYALWIPAYFIKDCISITDIIDKVLRKFHPHLQTAAGNMTMKLLTNEGERLLIVVDDINRLDMPVELVRKLLTWLKPESSNSSTKEKTPSQFIILCPIWPLNWRYFREYFSKESWVNTIFIGPMTTEEASQAVQSATAHINLEISKAEASDMATKMANDPFIIGSFSLMLTKTESTNLHLLTEDTIKKFIESCVQEIASLPKASYLSSEYFNTLSKLTLLMLRHNKLHPTWNEIHIWLKDSPTELSQLRELVKSSRLCKLTDQGEFVFRHDRIQENLLVLNLTKILEHSTLDDDMLKEPFYATIIGQALTHLPQNRKFLQKVKVYNPLALFEAFRHFGTNTGDYNKLIINELIEWGKNNVIDGVKLNSVFNAICWTLVNTDSPSVLDITKEWPPGPLVLLARLRNGSAASGALYCCLGPDYTFMFRDKLRDKVIDHVKKYHEDKLLKGIKQLAESPAISDKLRIGLLTFIGFLRSTNLDKEILKCWELVTDKINALPAAIWATARCYSDKSDKLLDLLMKNWADLPNKENSDKTFPKRDIATALHHGFAYGVPDKAIKYFLSQYEVYESLRWPITYLCERIDSPEAVEFIVKRAAEIEENISGTEKFSPWLIILADRWNPSGSRGRSLSNASMIQLKNLWENQQNNKFVRRQAFHIWLKNISSDQLDTLKSITSNTPLFHDALRKRAEFGDYSCVPDLIPILEKKSYWFNIVHHVWCDDIMAIAQRYLQDFKNNIPTNFAGGRSNTHYDLSNMLMMISVKDAENLLETNWNHLGYSTLFIQTALYVGTPTCLKLAAHSISRCPKDIYIFSGIGIHFGFLDSRRQKYLTKEHLSNLRPYLDNLKNGDLWQLAETCQLLGISEWGVKHLSNRLDETHRKYFYPSDDDLLNEFNEFLSEKHLEFKIKYWLERFQKRYYQRYYPQKQIINIVDRWLRQHPSLTGLKIAALFIETIGTRKDMTILDKYPIKVQPDEINNIKKNTEFTLFRRSLD